MEAIDYKSETDTEPEVGLEIEPAPERPQPPIPAPRPSRAISTRSCMITFYGNRAECPHCETNIQVDEIPSGRNFDGSQDLVGEDCDPNYYRLKFSYEFSDGMTPTSPTDYQIVKYSAHPFFNAGRLPGFYWKGCSIVKNPMTRALIDFLLMEESELAKHTGITTPKEYKKSIMVMLTHIIEEY